MKASSKGITTVTGFEVYKMCLSLKQHFTKPDYDYYKYNGKIRANEKSI